MLIVVMGSLLRLWLRLWNVMLDVIFMLWSVFIGVTWLVSNNRECLMCHWKKSCVVFIIPKHNLWYTPLNVSFGLTWHMLTPCYDIKQVTSSLFNHLVFDFNIIYALIINVLSLCIIMAVIALLVGRSQSLASLHPILSMSSTRASNSL